LSDVLTEADQHLAAGESAASRVWPTGFAALDAALGGGLRSAELTLLGGPQGSGKTSFVLQALHNTVASGGAAVYFSFEHSAQTLLQRFISLEAAHAGGQELPLRVVRDAMEASDARTGSLADRLAAVGAGEAVRRVGEYGQRMMVHRSTGATTDLDEITAVALDVAKRTGQTPVVVVDYLQKVAPKDPARARSDDGHAAEVVEGLKDLALEHDLPVLAIVAADKEALVSGKRLRIHDLRGSSALAYEPDVVLIMNDKYDVVARHHLMYNTVNAERFHDWSVITIEKNRSGRDRVDIEFLKRFEYGVFDRSGKRVAEQLIDERTFSE
jgi:replicative DNA helicase